MGTFYITNHRLFCKLFCMHSFAKDLLTPGLDFSQKRRSNFKKRLATP